MTFHRRPVDVRAGSGWFSVFNPGSSVAQDSEDLRQFHGKACYIFLKAMGILSTSSQETTASSNLASAVSDLDPSLPRLRTYRRWYAGLRSTIGIKLSQPPALDNEPPCSGNHVRDCSNLSWQARRKGVLDNLTHNGKYLNANGGPPK